MQKLQFLSNTAETKIEMSTAKVRTEDGREKDQIVLKVRSIEVKDKTPEVLGKLKKINELIQKKLYLEEKVRELQCTKEALAQKLETAECRCTH